MWPGFEPRGYFHICVDSSHFWGVQNFDFQIFFFFFFFIYFIFFFFFFFWGGGGVRKNEHFRGYDEIVDIFGGRHKAELFWNVVIILLQYINVGI